MMRRLLSLTACLVAAGTIAACAQQEPVVGEGTSAASATYLVINEFTSGSSGRVEVYNPTTQVFSAGVPMITGGDEMLRSVSSSDKAARTFIAKP